MTNFEDYYLKIEYDKFSDKDKLSDLDKIINWEVLRPIVKDLYHNNTEKGGRPNIDEIVMIKSLFLQAIYNLSDEGLEREMHDRISFRNFLHYPEIIPDARTIWYFRDLLSKTETDKTLWKAIWEQFKMKGIKVKNGTIQDATFITSDPGHGNYKKDKGNTMKFLEPVAKEDETKKEEDGRGEQARTRRSRDGTWAKKNDRSYFGYKLHTIEETEHDMIINYSVTTAKVHDSQVDLSISGIPVYRDKGYFGVEPRGIDGTMDRAKKGKKLSIESIRRNLRIARKRSKGERPYAVIKRFFHGGHVLVTTVVRVRVKAMFLCLAHNLFNFVSLKNRGLIA